MERHNGIEPDPEGAFVYYADAQAMVEALQRERDEARKRVDELEAREVDVVLLRDELDTVREKAAKLEAAANYYKQPSKNGGVYSVGGGHIGNLMDWCKDNLAHCKFSGPDEDNLDLDLVQTVQQIPQLETALSQLQVLVRALPVVGGPVKDEDILDNWESDRITFDALRGLLEYRATLDATTPAAQQRQVHSCEIPGCVSCANPEAGGDGE